MSPIVNIFMFWYLNLQCCHPRKNEKSVSVKVCVHVVNSTTEGDAQVCMLWCGHSDLSFAVHCTQSCPETMCTCTHAADLQQNRPHLAINSALMVSGAITDSAMYQRKTQVYDADVILRQMPIANIDTTFSNVTSSDERFPTDTKRAWWVHGHIVG